MSHVFKMRCILIHGTFQLYIKAFIIHPMQTDFLIVGQGLAGSLLAWELMRRGSHVTVLDKGMDNASLIAAGIINPITGMRFVKTADIETLLPTALECYANLSDFFGHQFYVAKPMLRIFRDKAELDHCKKRQVPLDYAPYLGELAKPELAAAGFTTPFGYVEQRQAGYLLTAPLLANLKQFFIERNAYRSTSVDYQAIHIDSAVHFEDITAKSVVFCEGYQASRNPWFSWLPFQPAKGEILTLSHELELPDAIVNYGNWLLPIASSNVRIGATFDREQLDTIATEQGKAYLLNTLSSFSASLSKSNVINHQAGIRPCTADRNPFLGKHPHHDRVAIFNGFGAKGSLQIPWYSQQFADSLLHNIPLPSSCDIQRYRTSHFSG